MVVVVVVVFIIVVVVVVASTWNVFLIHILCVIFVVLSVIGFLAVDAAHKNKKIELN
jgi:hypothetical protein